jgi:hypothetical protein
MTPEQRKKLSDAHLGQKAWNKGKKMSLEHRQVLSVAQTGAKKAEATKARMSLSHKGARNYLWKGENVAYSTIHNWVDRWLPKRSECDYCGTTEERMYHWANKSHEYKRDLEDWYRLCVPCHSAYDRGSIIIESIKEKLN